MGGKWVHTFHCFYETQGINIEPKSNARDKNKQDKIFESTPLSTVSEIKIMHCEWFNETGVKPGYHDAHDDWLQTKWVSSAHSALYSRNSFFYFYLNIFFASAGFKSGTLINYKDLSTCIWRMLINQ